ncbi:chromate efflux transporter [Aquimarina sp. TRL1]|uniref:chromate efflux transporter n=1 Tax=Aquimarina sp. (strain TRL1) TaxID=2736252 RepID=UPI00158A8426|nr:chromate efflux transporter [Aquimarina sp. TRL1]QKX04382.1 chromate efflux transporter [Aquimarina sp. TRL1]
MSKRKHITEVATVFLKLGCFAFGGPAAHIAMMEEEIVHKRKWMDQQHFLDLMGATNLIPGPNSTEMTMHCGHKRAGIPGLFIAGICFIFPAVLITGLLAWLYMTYGTIPEVHAFMYGIKPAVLVIILSAVLKLGKKALKNIPLAILGIATLIASFVGINEITALLAAGIIGALFFFITSNTSQKNLSLAPIIFFQSVSSSATLFSTTKTFWTFLKVGSILYGSGYVLFAYLDVELVAKGLLSRQQLLDAIAIGQFTPGPILSTSTFIGYQLNGFWGAIAASLGMFLPSFLFVLILNPLIPKMRKSVFLSYFLDAVNIAAVAIMISVLIKMGNDILIDWKSILICCGSLICFFFFKKINTLWIILGGAVSGYILSFI